MSSLLPTEKYLLWVFSLVRREILGTVIGWTSVLLRMRLIWSGGQISWSVLEELLNSGMANFVTFWYLNWAGIKIKKCSVISWLFVFFQEWYFSPFFFNCPFPRIAALHKYIQRQLDPYTSYYVHLATCKVKNFSEALNFSLFSHGREFQSASFIQSLTQHFAFSTLDFYLRIATEFSWFSLSATLGTWGHRGPLRAGPMLKVHFQESYFSGTPPTHHKMCVFVMFNIRFHPNRN